jgi:hypothetical protein
VQQSASTYISSRSILTRKIERAIDSRVNIQGILFSEEKKSYRNHHQKAYQKTVE